MAEYLSRPPKGRVVRVKAVGADDYVIGIEDVRDGRTHIVRTADDLERWLVTFTQGRCEPVGFGICGVCDHIHRDRDIDGGIFTNCIRCATGLIEIFAEFRVRPGGCLTAKRGAVAIALRRE